MSHRAKVFLTDSEFDKSILYDRTNDLSTKLSPDGITNNIITFSTSTKTSTNKGYAWDITKRNDKWDNKGRKVNFLLKVLCKSADIPYIGNNNSN